MTKMTLRRLLALTATTSLAAALGACGPDGTQQGHAPAALLSQSALQTGWSMNDLAGVDPAFLAGNSAPLPQALPMRASYRGGYDYAPAYDYGPEPYYDDGYYAGDVGPDDYQWLALAASLGGMFGNAPPDYGFGYDGVEPWAWETGDRYLRYAEPVYGGYRYYYYEPDSYAPFLISDPYYSYGYRDDRLVAIYDRSGRVLDVRRADRQRQAAQDYYARAQQMYRAAHREQRLGVPAMLWDNHRDEIARNQRQWDQARIQRTAWRTWDAKNEPRLHRDWAGEALVRREAEHSFAGWRKADFKTPAPRFYSPQQRQAQLQKVAVIREQRQPPHRNAQQAARQPSFVAPRAQPQRQAQQQARQAMQQRQALARTNDRRQQAQAQNAAHQRQVQVERANTQRQAQVQKQAQQHQQQALRAAADRRQQAAREHQLEAQRATQRRQAEQAQQARSAQRESQAQARQAGERQQQARARQAAKQAQQRQHQAQAQQAAERQSQQRQAQQAAQRQQQQAQARQAAQQARAAQRQQAQQARAAKPQPSAPQQQGGGNGGHGKGHGHDRG